MKEKYHWLKSYILITLSCVLYSFSFECFFQPNAVVMGGFSGIAQILNHFFPALPIGATVFVMNVPLMILGVKKQGWRLLAASVFAIAVSSAVIDLLAAVVTFPGMDPMLACLYGGLLLGVSLGVMLREGATTGGTELAAKLLKYRFRNLSVGRLCLIIDVLVIGLYALTFRNVNNALYGIISMYVCSLVMDMVVYGSITAKLAYIISDENDRIREKLMEMGLGGTIVQGKGAYTGERKNVLLCAAKPSNLAAIKSVVASVDKENAFVIVCDAREVFGEGFGTHSEDPM